MSTNYCNSCGAALENGMQFCKNCGAPAAAQPVVNQQPMNQQPMNQQPMNQQPLYQAAPPQYQQPYAGYVSTSQSYPQAPSVEPLGVGQYIGMMFLGAIPLVGFILLLVWAFSSDTNLNKRNYARAILILMLVGIAFSIIFSAALVGIMTTAFSGMSKY